MGTPACSSLAYLVTGLFGCTAAINMASGCQGLQLAALQEAHQLATSLRGHDGHPRAQLGQRRDRRRGLVGVRGRDRLGGLLSCLLGRVPKMQHISAATPCLSGSLVAPLGTSAAVGCAARNMSSKAQRVEQAQRWTVLSSQQALTRGSA